MAQCSTLLRYLYRMRCSILKPRFQLKCWIILFCQHIFSFLWLTTEVITVEIEYTRCSKMSMVWFNQISCQTCSSSILVKKVYLVFLYHRIGYWLRIILHFLIFLCGVPKVPRFRNKRRKREEEEKRKNCLIRCFSTEIGIFGKTIPMSSHKMTF